MNRVESDEHEARARAISSVERLDAVAFATVVGGLILVPENLHSVHRLEVAGNLAVAGRLRGKADVTRTRARRVIGELAGRWTGHNDDPWPNLATEAFVYHGGTHLFIPGGIDTLFILRALARAVRACSEDHREFAERAASMIQFACAISDDTLAFVGAQRNARVPDPTTLVVPATTALQGLRAAVMLSRARFERLRRAGGITTDDAERFCALVGSGSEPEPLRSFELLSVRPLLRRGDDVVVLAPHLLAEAAVRNVLMLAAELAVHDLLSREFHRRAWLAVDEALGLLGLTRSGPARSPVGSPPGMHVAHAIYQCDRDKLQHLMLVSDALAGSPVGPWDASHLQPELQQAQERIGESLRTSDPPVDSWTSIVVVSGMGRDYGVSFQERGVPTWSLSAADLETIAHAERPDPLLLWKHKEALDHVRRSSVLTSWSPLDTYAHWKVCARRFHRGNGPVPHLIGVAPDMGETLRHDAASKRDWRALPSWEPGRVIEVALAEGRERSIYMPRSVRQSPTSLAVDTAGPLVWLVGPPDLQRGSELHHMGADIVRMAAFWIWEFAAALRVQIASLDALDPVVVECGVSTSVHGNMPAYEIKVVEHRRVSLSVLRAFYETYDATNRAEREFAALLVTSVLEAAGLENARELVREILEQVAPLGVKRMLHAVRSDSHPSFLAAHQLPSPRYVSDHDVNWVVGIGLGESQPGTLRGGAAKEWMNAAVGRLYRILKERLAALDAHDALSCLLLANEALVHEDDERDMTLASVLACSERTIEFRGELQERVARHARAAIATRFLIEHVSAEPPNGEQKLSLAEFDRLLALASEIFGLGIASDALAFELAGPHAHVEVGETGYSFDLDGFEGALSDGRGHLFTERLELEAGRAQVPGLPAAESVSGPPDTSELSVGVEAEFGRGLSDIAFFFGELLALAREREEAIVQESTETLVEWLSKRLGWPRGDVRSLLSQFVLEPRASFLSAPPPYKPTDIWPWRFNRGLSYLRRPVVRRPDDVLLFTPGNVAQSAANLMGLLLTARFKARTPELRASMDRFVQAPSREFVDEVARTLETRGLVVRTHVNKIGRTRIEKARGEGKGDVDVLVADRGTRRIVAIECKDFQQDRVPHEIRADLETLFVDHGQRASAQTKHLTRLQWLRSHRDEVANWLANSSGEGWTVDAAIVISRPLVAPHLGRAQLPVWTLGQLRRGEGP